MKKPNLNGPRFRFSKKSVLTAETFKEFKKKYPEYKDMSLVTFKTIVKTFNQEMINIVTSTRNGLELPEGLGFLILGSCQHVNKNIDYKKSVEVGIKVTHKNWDSDNRLLKIFYTNYKSKYPFMNKQAWSFKATKCFRKQASEIFKTEYLKFVEIEPTSRVSHMFDRSAKKNAVKLDNSIPNNYNEFNI